MSLIKLVMECVLNFVPESDCYIITKPWWYKVIVMCLYLLVC